MLDRELASIARRHHAAHPDGPSAERIRVWLGALMPRVMFPGGWAAAARHAGAEPLWTGRARPYDESTLRRVAARLDDQGASEHVAAVLRRQVDRAVRAGDDEVIGYTDMFDQPYYTKKLAHAGPVGRLGNRLLAGTYFGLTTVRLPAGPTLFVHLSWHKPASPLRDALEDLLDDEQRLRWWQRHVRLHVWDRGANGDAVLAWAWAMELPYLTIGRTHADLWRFRAPTKRNALGLPIVVRPDRRLDGDADNGPWEVVVPADAKDPDERRGIRFRAGVALSETDLSALNALYKSRWPSMENEIKALQSRGFGRNRTRRLEPTTRRGADGQLERLREREQSLRSKLREVSERPVSGANFERLVGAGRKVVAVCAAQTRLTREETLKHARPAGGAERVGKWLHLLGHNALTLALLRSAEPEVRAMDAATVFELLLDRPALTCIEEGRMTMWVDALAAATDRRRQAALIEVFNRLRLRSRGRVVVIRLRERSAKKTL